MSRHRFIRNLNYDDERDDIYDEDDSEDEYGSYGSYGSWKDQFIRSSDDLKKSGEFGDFFPNSSQNQEYFDYPQDEEEQQHNQWPGFAREPVQKLNNTQSELSNSFNENNKVIQQNEKKQQKPKSNQKPATKKEKVIKTLNSNNSNSSSNNQESELNSSKEIKKIKKQMTTNRRKQIEEKIATKPKEEKENINLVIIGHVDAGKSTIMGHLLFLLGNVTDRQMHRFKTDSENQGKSSFQFAWVLDQHDEERERGVTIDVAVSSFETPKKNVTLLDAPGHRDFIPNMISGAAQADVAILVLNATNGEFETGFAKDGQTKEHAILVRSLGVTQLVVAVNKLDTVEWSKKRFDFIKTETVKFLKDCGFQEKNLTYIPCSGFNGENLKENDNELLKCWYNGPTLIEAIDSFVVSERDQTKPFRLCISDLFKAQNLGLAVGGKVETGIVSVGDNVMVVPVMEQCQVKSIRKNGEAVDYSVAGENIDLVLSSIEDTHLSTGNFLCDPENVIPCVQKFRAQIITTHHLNVPILKGQNIEIHSQSFNEPAHITKLVSILHKSTGQVTKKRPKCLGENITAIVEIKIRNPICVELYSEYKQFGRVMLRENGRTIAIGVIRELL